ncbi:hypothetical protein ACYOEI_28925 [Singulisphaera rosea]
MIVRGLKPEDILLVGRLVVLDAGLKNTRPHLGLVAWCPFCKREHSHGWGDPPFRRDDVSHRNAHCNSPAAPTGYYVGLDPSHVNHNDKITNQVRVLQEGWDKRRRAKP